MTEDERKKIQLQIKRLEERLARADEPKLTPAQRRLMYRQHFILGAWLAKHRPKTVEEIKQKLERPQDRLAFGLPPVDNAPADIAGLANAASAIN